VTYVFSETHVRIEQEALNGTGMDLIGLTGSDNLQNASETAKYEFLGDRRIKVTYYSTPGAPVREFAVGFKTEYGGVKDLFLTLDDGEKVMTLRRLPPLPRDPDPPPPPPPPKTEPKTGKD
jgi:hypothetical protein